MKDLKIFQCIVAYVAKTPFYYAGYYKQGKPVLTIDFNKALKLHSTDEAKRILLNLKVDWEIEEHGYVS